MGHAVLLLDHPRHQRAIKARATRFGDKAAADQADIALRAHRVAKAIKAAVEGAPPLPDHVINALRDLLPPAGGEA